MPQKPLATIVLTLCVSGCSMPWAPHCDIRKVHIGMTRDEVLEACPSPDREYDFPEGKTYKIYTDELHEEKPDHWIFWRFWSQDRDVVTLKNGRVDYAKSYGSRP